MTHPDPDDYQRGFAAGDVAARLADHDRHFAAINGHLVELARLVAHQDLVLANIATLTEQAARTKPALLSPVQRVLAEMTALAGFAAFTAWVLSLFNVFGG